MLSFRLRELRKLLVNLKIEIYNKKTTVLHCNGRQICCSLLFKVSYRQCRNVLLLIFKLLSFLKVKCRNLLSRQENCECQLEQLILKKLIILESLLLILMFHGPYHQIQLQSFFLWKYQ